MQHIINRGKQRAVTPVSLIDHLRPFSKLNAAFSIVGVALLVPGIAFALSPFDIPSSTSPLKNADDQPTEAAHVVGTTTDQAVGTESAVEDPPTSTSNLDVVLDSSTAGDGSTDASVRINGQRIPLQEKDRYTKTIKGVGSQTQIDINIDNNSSMSGTSYTDIQINSSSEVSGDGRDDRAAPHR